MELTHIAGPFGYGGYALLGSETDGGFAKFIALANSPNEAEQKAEAFLTLNPRGFVSTAIVIRRTAVQRDPMTIANRS